MYFCDFVQILIDTGLRKTELLKAQKRDIVDARQMLYFACQERPIRLAYIKKFLAEYGYEVQHSTILHGIKQAKKLIDSDPDYKEILEKIQSE